MLKMLNDHRSTLFVVLSQNDNLSEVDMESQIQAAKSYDVSRLDKQIKEDPLLLSKLSHADLKALVVNHGIDCSTVHKSEVVKELERFYAEAV